MDINQQHQNPITAHLILFFLLIDELEVDLILDFHNSLFLLYPHLYNHETDFHILFHKIKNVYSYNSDMLL